MKIVLLNSGGLDSALKAKELKLAGHEVHSLFIEVAGQLGLDKIKVASQETADKFCASHHIIKLDLGYIPNHWESVEGNVGYVDGSEQPTPETKLWSGPENQSSVFLSLAVSYAKRIGATEVHHGYNRQANADVVQKYKEAMEANGAGGRLKPQIAINESSKKELDEGEFNYVVKSTPI